MSYYDTSNSPHMSSVAPRAPLPGYDDRDRDYRSPTHEVGDAWGPTSPPRGESGGGGGGSHDGWGQHAAPATPSSPFPTSTTANPTLVPRAPQTLADPSRRNNAASDYGPPEPAGGGGGGPSSTLSPAQSSKEAFIRIRILGIDRQKKDMYIKFNAEVSPSMNVASRVVSG